MKYSERALFFEMACRIIVQSRMDYTVPLARKDERLKETSLRERSMNL